MSSDNLRLGKSTVITALDGCEGRLMSYAEIEGTVRGQYEAIWSFFQEASDRGDFTGLVMDPYSSDLFRAAFDSLETDGVVTKRGDRYMINKLPSVYDPEKIVKQLGEELTGDGRTN
jgi:hypothetical protein